MQPPSTDLDKNGNLITHPAGSAQSGHPTYLYDPAVHEDQIVVMFESAAEAEAAIARLRSEGIAADAAVTDRTADGANAGVNAEGGNTGLWGSLKGLFAPDDEVHGLAEGVRRGHALLVIHPEIESRNRVIDLLEASNPIDFDARLEQWRTDGWRNLRQQEATAMGTEADAPRRAGVRDTTRGATPVRRYYAPRDPG